MTGDIIAILLCTYNSSEYLSEQLESLYLQTYQDFWIYVHDDGSTDDTLDILRSYSQSKGKLTIMDDVVQHRKANGSFVWLMERVESDYYMFCDHDDVWLPEKIEKSFSKLRQCELQFPGKPVVVNSDLKVVSAGLVEIAPSFWRYNGICRPLLNTFDYLAVYNAFNGCSMIFNRLARDISLPVSEKSSMHDKWIGLKVASVGGCIDYVDEPLMLYRQHGNNELGADKVGGKYYFRRLLTARHTMHVMKAHLDMVRAIRPFSWFRFFRFKCQYYYKRRKWYQSV